VMTNTASKFEVDGNVTIGTRNYNNLTAGTMWIGGDFTQTVTNSSHADNFAASGSHKVILCGDKKQTITFSSECSYFNVLELQNDEVYSDCVIPARQVIDNGYTVNYKEGVAGWTLEENMIIEDDLYITSGVLDLNGHKLVVNGNLILGDGQLKVNEGSLVVKKDMRLQGKTANNTYSISNAQMYMQSEKDYILVQGDFYFQSNRNHSGMLTDGTLELKGNFVVCEAMNGYFVAINNHTIMFTGTTEQNINNSKIDSNYATTNNAFANVVINNSSNAFVKNNTNITVNGTIDDISGNVGGEKAICINKLSQINNYEYSGTVGLKSAQTCDANLTIGGALHVNGGFNANGKTIKVGSVVVNDGAFNVNGGTILIDGDFFFNPNNNSFVMKNALDYVLVGGNFTTLSYNNNNGNLTNGVLEVKGNFLHYSNAFFYATENHKVILSGKLACTGRRYVQVITCINTSNFRFNILEIEKDDDYYSCNVALSSICNSLIRSNKDMNPPSKVTGIRVYDATASSVKLAWNPSSDDGVSGYEVYRDGTKIATVGTTSYIDRGLQPEVKYTYVVYAFDEQRNISDVSDSVSQATLADDEAPATPSNVRCITRTGNSVTIGWNSASDNVGVTGYKVYRNNELVAELGNVNTYKDSDVENGITYKYAVAACDGSGNESKKSATVSGYAKMPKITGFNPSNGSTLGTDTIIVNVYYENVGNSTGNKVQLEYSNDNEKTWNKVNETLMGQNIYNSNTLYSSIIWNTKNLGSGEYKLRATLYDADNNKNVSYATYQLDKDAPEAPKDLICSSQGGAVTVEFLDSLSADVSYYSIYRKQSLEVKFTKIKTITAKKTDIQSIINFFDDCSVQQGATYEYYITATDNFGHESNESNIYEITVEKDTVAPVVENVTPGNKTRINGSRNITVSAYDKSGINTIQMFYEKEQDNWVKISEQTANSQGTAVINWDSKNLKDGSYKVKFVAIDKNGNESEPFTTTYVTDNTGISKIELTDVTADTSYVSLRWKDVAENDFSYFQVEQVLEDGTIKKIGTVSNTLGYHVKNLNPNETYKFQVVGYDTLGNRGIPSDVYSVVTKKDTVSPVINQFGPANLPYSNEIKLSISVKDDVGAVKATFSYSTDEKTWKEITTINKPAKENNTFSYTWDVSGITKDMVYVRVQAWDAAGNENYYVNSTTNEEGILTNKYCLDKTAPDKINDLKATPEDGYVALTWTQPKADDVDHYVIYRAPKETGDYDKLRNNWRNSNYYDTTAKYGKEYSYKITSVDQAGNESEYSNESSSSIKKDETKPTVCSISPSDKDTVGANTKIQALVYDNVKVATVTAEIISKKDSSGVGNVIGEKEINKKDALVSFDWDTTGLESGTYSVNVYATDVSGYVSETLTSTFTLDNDAPATPVLTVEEKNWELDLSWTENKETDMQGYEIYRKAYDEQTFKLIGNTTEQTYKDKDVSPYSTYSYYVIACDNVKNASQSNTVEAQRPGVEDVISPVAYTSEMLAGVAGKEINFDGTASTDNNRIVKYTWDFGDGSAKENGSQIGHIYKNAGTYTAVLTVADAAGNENSITVTVVVYEPTTSGTITLRVVDEQNRPIDSAAVYVNDNSTNGKKHGMTNSNGYVILSGKSGTYNIAAYKKD
ncbi:MAG: PKD domain-containing protein, partial [Lachnospiraceae bacterium]|nr:PKD domain-containing protein [Lachnospiraceae bacterium]